MSEVWTTMLHAFGRHNRHLLDRLVQREELHFVAISTENAGKGSCRTRVTNTLVQSAIAANHRCATSDRGSNSVFRNGMSDHHSAFFTILFERFCGEAFV